MANILQTWNIATAGLVDVMKASKLEKWPWRIWECLGTLQAMISSHCPSNQRIKPGSTADGTVAKITIPRAAITEYHMTLTEYSANIYNVQTYYMHDIIWQTRANKSQCKWVITQKWLDSGLSGRIDSISRLMLCFPADQPTSVSMARPANEGTQCRSWRFWLPCYCSCQAWTTLTSFSKKTLASKGKHPNETWHQMIKSYKITIYSNCLLYVLQLNSNNIKWASNICFVSVAGTKTKLSCKHAVYVRPVLSLGKNRRASLYQYKSWVMRTLCDLYQSIAYTDPSLTWLKDHWPVLTGTQGL